MPLTWEHVCPLRGRMLLTAAQMGVYVTDRFGKLHEMRKKGTWFEADERPGCPWCGELPPDLAALLAR